MLEDRPHRIYIGASSRDLERYKRLVSSVRNSAFMRLTYDWSMAIEHAREKQWTDADCPVDFQRRTAGADFAGVSNALVFIGLLPDREHVTAGLWTELGIALGLRALQGTPRIVLSAGGVPDTRRQYSIFETLADVVTSDDATALAAASHEAFLVTLNWEVRK